MTHRTLMVVGVAIACCSVWPLGCGDTLAAYLVASVGLAMGLGGFALTCAQCALPRRRDDPPTDREPPPALPTPPPLEVVRHGLFRDRRYAVPFPYCDQEWELQ